MAKNQLSALLDRVRHGETVVIEDRGIPIARLTPIDHRTAGPERDHLARLERHGILRPPRTGAVRPGALLQSPPTPPARPVVLSRIVARERDESW